MIITEDRKKLIGYWELDVKISQLKKKSRAKSAGTISLKNDWHQYILNES